MGFGRVLAIVNPVAGHARGLPIGAALEEALRSQAVECELRPSRSGVDVEQWTASAPEEGFDAVVVIGGDGTLQEAAAGLVRADRRVPVAHLPVGTANVIAALLRLPHDVDGVVDTLVRGRVEPFDVGYLPDRDQYFLLTAALGVPARIIEGAPRGAKSRSGFAAYVRAGLAQALHPHPARVRIETDTFGASLLTHTVFVANIAGMEGWLRPPSTPHDGLLDVLAVEASGLLGTARALAPFFLGQHKSRRLRHLQCRRVRIEATPPMPVEIDGEPAGATPLTAEVRPGAIDLILP